MYHGASNATGIEVIDEFITAICCLPGNIANRYTKEEGVFSDLGNSVIPGPPEHVIDIENLDTGKMLKYLQKLNIQQNGTDYNSKVKWRLLGNTCCLFTNKYQNCSSLCYELLKKGGFLKKLTRNPFTVYNERQHPDTKAFIKYCFCPSTVFVVLWIFFTGVVFPILRDTSGGNQASMISDSNSTMALTSGDMDSEEPELSPFQGAVLIGFVASFIPCFMLCLFEIARNLVKSCAYDQELITSPFSFTSQLVELARDRGFKDISFPFTQGILKDVVVVDYSQPEDPIFRGSFEI